MTINTSDNARIDLMELSPREMEDFLAAEGLPRFRAAQLLQWLYVRRAKSIDDITVFSKDLRAKLAEKAYIGALEVADVQSSSDGTRKFLFTLKDGLSIEAVLIPDEDRLTLCVSSQVGCAMGCRFCRTGQGGFVRDLSAAEIVGQLLAAQTIADPQAVTNVVFMGMGEPTKNIDAVAEAVVRMTGLVGLSGRRITISTVGNVPGMQELPRRIKALDSTLSVKLAVSLNATTDALRDEIMPINRRYNIAALLEACRRYPLKSNQKITFEYVMLGGLNDTPEDAQRLVRLLRGIPAKINLIPFNEFKGSSYRRPSEGSVAAFQAILYKAGYTAIIRSSKGADILASCGQLLASQKT